jgi:hypothetical protein
MATAKPYPDQGSRQPRRRWLTKLALAGLALMLVALAFGWNQLSLRAVAAAAYAARVGCSCRFVAGRDLGDCRKDFIEGLGPVRLSEDDASHAVSARYLLFAGQTARLQEGAGCVLDPWKGS